MINLVYLVIHEKTTTITWPRVYQTFEFIKTSNKSMLNLLNRHSENEMRYFESVLKCYIQHAIAKLNIDVSL